MFSESKSIEELSRNFIMVNCLDEEEPVHAVFKPVSARKDGAMVPTSPPRNLWPWPFSQGPAFDRCSVNTISILYRMLISRYFRMARTFPAFYSWTIKRPCLTQLCSTDADLLHTSTSTGALCVFIAYVYAL
jgi:hypothetical protein